MEAAETARRSNGNWRRQLRRRLLAWYAAHARDLPWRRTRDPYAIWVSEIMLQQTQVATVEGYFERFLSTFPTVSALAAAPAEQVLRQWEGLGYYRRARQMQAAAQEIDREHGGRFPRDRAQVLALPGIGRYTAGAILSIAFGQREPILEANTFRLLSRLIAYRGDPQSPAGRQALWQAAEELVPVKDAGAFNQALMELGSLVCTPRAPRCDACPVQSLCRAFAAGIQAEVGRAAAKPASTAVREAAVVVRHGSSVLLIERGAAGRWAGLWDFPRFELSGRKPSALAAEARQTLRERFAIDVESLAPLTTLKHSVTRFRITLVCYEGRYRGGRPAGDGFDSSRWVQPAALVDFPLSVTGRKLARLIANESSAGAQ
ncbi:MAG TPA: A/G-specific adenine glycosylase [Pirellulales bacterium]|nr:A/G-specific adenine glycosylase [Pirellulales bacterium]